MQAAPRRWSPGHSLALLLAAIAASFFLVVWMAATEPPDSIATDKAECLYIDPDSQAVIGAGQLHLPFSKRLGNNAQLRCSFDLDLTDDETRNVALLIPSLSDKVIVSINGQRSGTLNVHLMRNLFISTLPAFVPGLDDFLVPGINRFEITVSAQPGRITTLDRILVGDAKTLLPYYQSKWLLTAIMPTVVVGSEIALAVIFGLIWMARPRERELGWLAVMLMLAALRGTAIIPDFGLSSTGRSLWNGLVVWEAFAGFMFSGALIRTSFGRGNLLLAAPALVFTAVYAFGPVAQLVQPLVYSAMGLIILYLAAAVWMLVRATFRGNRDVLFVMPGMIALVAFVAHDFFVVLNAGISQIFLARTLYGCFLIAVAALMTFRFVRAMTDRDTMTAALNLRVMEVEEQLFATFEELRKRREVEAIERERARLMRDLHDGIGGNLASILALADAERPCPAEIARHARDALTDMRLIISSLEDYGGDIALALGTWRERAGPLFRTFGLTIIWEVCDMPPLPGMGPTHVLDILRIVQEVVTNIMKHAHASHVWVKTANSDESICLSICDDGSEFVLGSTGNGIANMRARASRLGARLVIQREDNKTCVMLILPRNLPSIDVR